MTGFICIDKPQGLTSFTATNRARAILGAKKAGHTGTLDPMATGVLPVALSGASRFIALLPEHEKTYIARVRLGITTDTLDITGEVTGECPVNVTKEQVQKTVQSFLGESEQLPPMYSAVSQNGVRLYELARRGETVERKPRHIRISELVLSDMTAAEFTLRVTCSAGTYIRSLAHDIGQKLGTGAVLTALRRTAANGFTEKDCVTLEELECLRDENRLGEVLRPVDACLSAYPALTVTAAQGVRFQNGGDLLAAFQGNFTLGRPAARQQQYFHGEETPVAPKGRAQWFWNVPSRDGWRRGSVRFFHSGQADLHSARRAIPFRRGGPACPHK